MIAGATFITIAFDANRFGIDNWQSMYWADPSGYYVYLPATFIHGFYADSYPDDIEARIGHGFSIDKNNKIFTKYPMGPAILALPFFLIFHLLAFILGYEPDGFSQIYYYMPSVSTPLYLLAGLIFLYKFLRNYVNEANVILTLAIISLGTNLYYYAFISQFMSHTYSFALFTFFLFSLKKYIQSDFQSIKYLIFISLCTGFIFLTRPTNLVILLLIPFLDVDSMQSFKQRINQILSFRRILLFAAIILFTLFPQMLYWKFISGSFFVYSYGHEGFTHLFSPKVIEVMFSPVNGMLLYNPVILLFLFALIYGVIASWSNSLIIFIITIIALYIISSWNSFFYGCSYGCRPFLEYLSILALPFAMFLQESRKIVKAITVFLSGYLIYFNLNLIYYVFLISSCVLLGSWDNEKFIYGKNHQMWLWNWREYRNYIEKAKIFPWNGHHYVWSNNFEPDFEDCFGNSNFNVIKHPDAISGEYVTTTSYAYSSGFNNIMGDRISSYPINQIDVTAYINQVEVDSNAVLVCHIVIDETSLFWEGKKIVQLAKNQNEWELIQASFNLPPAWFPAKYSVYFWSPAEKEILIDDLKIVFRY